MAAFGFGGASTEADHDMEISYNKGEDFNKLKLECHRNPEHKKFIPASKFTMDDLPEQYQDSEILEYIKVYADLSVRLLVSHTSKERPKVYPRTERPYPAHDLIGTDCVRAGSGWIRQVYLRAESDAKKETCPCTECQHSKKPHKTWYAIEVPTANHLVFNTTEAQHTQADIFYEEDAENPGKIVARSQKLTGYRVWYNNIKDDKCWMYCATHDLDLGKKLWKMVARRDELLTKLLETYSTEYDAPFSVIVSHPHGCGKTITIGEFAAKELSVDSPWWTKATYNSMVCPGTSGGPVWSFGKKMVKSWVAVN